MFFIVQKIPGDPARAAAGQGATKERIIEIRKEFGLDLPVHVQIYRYFGRILNLDLGKSISSKKNVLDIILSGFLRKIFCSSIGSFAKFLHSFEQHPFSFSSQFSHCINKIWQASFLQSV